MKTIFAASALLIAASVLCPLNSRSMVLLSYRELFSRSDLVVIATPSGHTADTMEVSVLPGIVRQGWLGRQSQIATIGVETPFKVSVILKGEQSIEQFVLHHYREAVAEESMNGPILLQFDTSQVAKRRSYLIFLIRETDGRYAPTGGQTDPGLNSVIPVPLDSTAAFLLTANP